MSKKLTKNQKRLKKLLRGPHPQSGLSKKQFRKWAKKEYPLSKKQIRHVAILADIIAREVVNEYDAQFAVKVAD